MTAQSPEALATGLGEKRPVTKTDFLLVLRQWPDAAARTAIIAVALVLACLTWAHWGDLQTDCGRELYVPLEILRGKLLYRDVWYPYGPLAPYVEAALVAIFGQHLTAFYLFGLAITIGCAILLHHLGAMLEQPIVGLTAAFGFLLQGFSPSYMNFIFPYSYAALIGLCLGLLCALLTVSHILARSQRGTLVLAGLAASLTLLCKPEIGQACYAMLACAIILDALIERSGQVLMRGIIACVPGVIISAAVYGWFLWTLSIRIVLDNWIGPPGPYFFERQGHYMYARLGFRFSPTELVLLAVSAPLSLALWYAIGRQTAGRRVPLWLGVAVGVQIAAARILPVIPGIATGPLQVLGTVRSILFYPRSMFFIGCMFLLCALYRLTKRPHNRGALAAASFDIFALFCALRVFAQVDPFGYAIYYVPPLFLIFMITVAETANYATAQGEGGRIKPVNVIMIAEMAMLILILLPGQAQRTAKFVNSWGYMYVTPGDAKTAGQILRFMMEQKKRDEHVVLLPEAPMFYALTGMEAPDRWYTFLPGFRSPEQEQEPHGIMGRCAHLWPCSY